MFSPNQGAEPLNGKLLPLQLEKQKPCLQLGPVGFPTSSCKFSNCIAVHSPPEHPMENTMVLPGYDLPCL